MNGRSFFLSVLIAGLVTGVLGNLPVLNLVNCVLCIFAWVGGALAVVLYRRFQAGGPAASVGQGAALGAVSGLVGAFLGALVYAVTSSLSAPLFIALARLFQVEGDLPFGGMGLGGILASTFFFLVVDAILYPLFGAIAGMITASLVREPGTVAA